MQKEKQPNYPLLYSSQGFKYCDLLLGQDKYQDVLSRGNQILEWAMQSKGVSRLDTALIYLSLGRAHLLQNRKRPDSRSAD